MVVAKAVLLRAKARNALQLQSTMGIEDNVAGHEIHLGKSLVAVELTQVYIFPTRLVWMKGDLNRAGMGYSTGHSFLPCIDVLGPPTASRSDVRYRAS